MRSPTWPQRPGLDVPASSEGPVAQADAFDRDEPSVGAARFDEVFGAARLAWPTVVIAADVFAAHLARHVPRDAALDTVHTTDLYLACACARGDLHAVRVFEQHCLDGLEHALSRYGGPDLIAEVKQRVRERVLVGTALCPPRIEGFSGRGDLRNWVRVLAVREALGIVRQKQREVSLDDDERLHALVTPADAELEHLKVRYLSEFKEAFSAALRGLSARDQTLLRQHVIDGLSIDQLGALYRVHRATAARNLQRARRAVLVDTRARLTSRLEIQPRELDSILRMIRSRLEVTLRWLVRRRPGPRGP